MYTSTPAPHLYVVSGLEGQGTPRTTAEREQSHTAKYMVALTIVVLLEMYLSQFLWNIQTKQKALCACCHLTVLKKQNSLHFH